MRHATITILLAIAVAAMYLAIASCSAPKKFKVDGTVDGNPTMNLYVKYFNDGSYVHGVTPVKDGKFAFQGSATKPVLISLLDNEGKVLARICAVNGDKLKVSINRANPYLSTAKGSQCNADWAEFCAANADTLQSGSPESVNAAIEEYSKAHPGSFAAAMAYAWCYDASIDYARADSVMRAISDGIPANVSAIEPVSAWTFVCDDSAAYRKVDSLKYRPSVGDTVLVFKPSKRRSLLVFSDDHSSRIDSVMKPLRSLEIDKNLYVLDIMLTPDSVAWRRAIRLDTVPWTEGWMPGGIYCEGIEHLSLPTLPYFILIDSAGNQLQRAYSLGEIDF